MCMYLHLCWSPDNDLLIPQIRLLYRKALWLRNQTILLTVCILSFHCSPTVTAGGSWWHRTRWRTPWWTSGGWCTRRVPPPSSTWTTSSTRYAANILQLDGVDTAYTSLLLSELTVENVEKDTHLLNLMTIFFLCTHVIVSATLAPLSCFTRKVLT